MKRYGIINSFDKFSAVQKLVSAVESGGEYMDHLYDIRNERVGDALDKVIGRMKDACDYKTPDDIFVPNKYDTFMQFFTRGLTKDAADKIRSNIHSAVISPCECNVESVGTIDDTSTIIRLKKSEEDVLSGMAKLDVNLAGMSFLNMKLLRAYYHWVHSPVSGRVDKIIPVDNGLFGKNTLWAVCIEGDIRCVLLLVGELSIQDFIFDVSVGQQISAFDKIGRFDWGSQVVMFVDKDMKDITRQKLFAGDNIY